MLSLSKMGTPWRGLLGLSELPKAPATGVLSGQPWESLAGGSDLPGDAGVMRNRKQLMGTGQAYPRLPDTLASSSRDLAINSASGLTSMTDL